MVRRIRHVFKWGTSEELVVGSKYSQEPERRQLPHSRTNSNAQPQPISSEPSHSPTDCRPPIPPLRWPSVFAFNPSRSRVVMESVEALALVGGHVEEEILLRNEYLAAENEILKSKLQGRPRFNDEERVRLATLGKQLGRKALHDVGSIVKPETILKWFRDLVAKKFDGSKQRRSPGRPRIDAEVEKLIVDNRSRQPDLGLRPNPRRHREPRSQDQRPDRRERLEAQRSPARSDTKQEHVVGRLHSGPLRIDRRVRFLHRGSTDCWRSCDVLRSLLRSPRISASTSCRRHRASERRMDETDRAQRDDGGLRLPQRQSVPDP